MHELILALARPKSTDKRTLLSLLTFARVSAGQSCCRGYDYTPFISAPSLLQSCARFARLARRPLHIAQLWLARCATVRGLGRGRDPRGADDVHLAGQERAHRPQARLESPVNAAATASRFSLALHGLIRSSRCIYAGFTSATSSSFCTAGRSRRTMSALPRSTSSSTASGFLAEPVSASVSTVCSSSCQVHSL